jgi:hypothetical protein
MDNTKSKIYKYLKYGAILIVVIIIIFIAYKFITNKVLKINQTEINIEKQIYSTEFKLDSDKFILPKNGYDYSISFWIHVNNYEYNIGKWKHIFHKGNKLETPIDFSDWDILKTSIINQSPGVWLHPTTNNIRIAFNTNINNLACEILNETNCETNCKLCKWDFNENKCLNVKNHPTNLEKQINRKCDTEIDGNSIEIEYVDLLDIPLKKMTNISFVLENKILNIYYNGILRKIHKFIGEPIFNKNDSMYFNTPETFEGTLFNFKYIPYEVDNIKIKEIYNDIPFTDKFTKKYRFNNYIKRFKIVDAVKTFFI